MMSVDSLRCHFIGNMLNYFVPFLLLLQFDAILFAIDYILVHVSWHYFFYDFLSCCVTGLALFFISYFFDEFIPYWCVLWSILILTMVWFIFLRKKGLGLLCAIDAMCIISGLLALAFYYLFLSYMKTEHAIGQIFS